MVDFSVKATGMSEPDTRAAKFIRPGVTDTSEAIRIAGQTELIKDVGSMALQAYEGYQIADESKQLQQLFEDFRAQREAPVEFAAAKTTYENLWKQAETSAEVTTDDITQAEKGVINSFNKLKNAHAQGALGVNELNTRITTILREAVNRNPGLEDKLVRYAKSYLELSGASSMMDQMARDEKARAEAKATEEKQIRKSAIDQGIDPDQDPLYRYKVVANNRRAYESDQFLKSQQVSKAQIEAVVNDSNLTNEVFTGTRTNVNVGIANIKSNPNLVSSVDKLNALNQLKASIIGPLQSRFGSAANQESIRVQINSINDIFKFAEEEISGKVQADVTSNRVKAAENVAKLQLNQFTADAVYGMVGKLPPEVSKTVMFKADGTFTPLAKGFLDAINSQGFGQSKLDTTADINAVRQMGSVTTKDAIADPAQVAKFSGMISSFHKEIYNPDRPTNERVKWADEFVFQLATPGANKAIKEMDTTTRQLAVTDVREYLDRSIQAMQSYTTYFDKTPIVRPKDLTIRGFEDGTIYFDSNENRTAAQRMTREFGTRLNNAIKAFANIQTNGDTRSILKYPEIQQLVKSVTQQTKGIGSRPLGAASPSIVLSPQELEMFAGKVDATGTGTPSMQVTPQQQRARDDKRLQILYQEREDQRAQGKVDTALEQEIANVEKQLGVSNKPNYGNRPDGTQKGTGWLGELKVPGTKDVATEYSVTVNIGGKDTLIPTLVPNLTKDEVNQVLQAIKNNKMPPDNIIDKAVVHAKQRMKEGKSPFKD